MEVVEFKPIEHEIMRHVVFGLTNQEIGYIMNYSRHTIEDRVKMIYEKMELQHLDHEVFVTRIVAIRRYNEWY